MTIASKYTLTDYSPDWPSRFQEEAARWRALLGDELVAIHHIGSTSVPGLAAKPTIDLLPLARSIAAIDERTVQLQNAGYRAWGEFGLPGRRYFTKDVGGLRTHNIHIYQFDDPDVERHLAFCAYLRHDENARKEYAELKREVYALHPANIEAYSAGKDAWIKKTECTAVEWYRRREKELDVSTSESASALDIESFWEYSDPAASEARFRAALETAHGDAALELRTQIARTYSLRQRFAEAHEILNEVERELEGAGPRPRIRFLLERGRTFNSAGEKEKARSLFVEAWEQAQANYQEGLEVDAAHMVAITYSGSEEAIEWNQRGLALAVPSRDPKARALIPAMLNNSAWDLHEMGRYPEALSNFEKAEAEWIARGKPMQIRIAKWAVARCLRSLGRNEEALTVQQALDAECNAVGEPDGHVLEEIAENLSAIGKLDEAKLYFEKAVDVLSKDEWFVKHGAARLTELALRARTG